MIITQKKPIEELMAMLGDAKRIGIIGCSSCATACATGGEKEIKELKAYLESQGRTVVVTGVVTNICVRSTCHDAFFRGYQVVVPRDCVRATGPREQESSLWDIETHFGAVTDSATILNRL